MKKIIFLLVCIYSLYSCQDGILKEIDSTKIKVLYENTPQPNASVMLLSSGYNESVLKCDNNGEITVDNIDDFDMLVAMAPHMSAIIKNPKSGYTEIYLESLNKNELIEKSVQYTGVFGVWDTDVNGDVRFRYQGDFLYYDCINYLPWLLTSPDPNDWDGWDLTDFSDPWEGKKLLVPTRYQTYHLTVYGYSISDALLLYSEI